MGTSFVLLPPFASGGTRVNPELADPGKTAAGWLPDERPAMEWENYLEYRRDTRINEVLAYLNNGVPINHLIDGTVMLTDSANRSMMFSPGGLEYTANNGLRTAINGDYIWLTDSTPSSEDNLYLSNELLVHEMGSYFVEHIGGYIKVRDTTSTQYAKLENTGLTVFGVNTSASLKEDELSISNPNDNTALTAKGMRFRPPTGGVDVVSKWSHFNIASAIASVARELRYTTNAVTTPFYMGSVVDDHTHSIGCFYSFLGSEINTRIPFASIVMYTTISYTGTSGKKYDAMPAVIVSKNVSGTRYVEHIEIINRGLNHDYDIDTNEPVILSILSDNS